MLRPERACSPNAEVIVHENEINHWFDDEAMAKAAERPKRRYFEAGRTQLKPYMAADRVRTFKKGEVLPGVNAIPIAGHTPGHTAYVVSSGGSSMVIWVTRCMCRKFRWRVPK